MGKSKKNTKYCLSAISILIIFTLLGDLLFAVAITNMVLVIIYFHISKIDFSKYENKTDYRILSFITTCSFGIYILSRAYSIYHNLFMMIGFFIFLLFASNMILFFLQNIYIFVFDKLRTIFKDTTKQEKIIMGISFILLSLLFLFFVLTATDAFLGKLGFDIIYSSDGTWLVDKGNFNNIYTDDNDLRSPYFLFFSLPFTGPLYLISKLLFCKNLFAILISIETILFVIIIGHILTKILSKNHKTRTVLFLLYIVSYSSILYSLIIEQYVISVFWLILMIYDLINDKKDIRTFVAASGTTLTSAVFFPFYIDKKDIWKSIKHLAIVGISTLIMFLRIDIIFSLAWTVKLYSSFTGQNLSMMKKALQFIAFAANIFLKPTASIGKSIDGRASWQLLKTQSPYVYVIGIIILFICVIGFIYTRKEKISQLSFYWVCFSVFLLLICGWGTAENGLVLYSFYFGWAYFILVYQCLKTILRNIKIETTKLYFISIPILIIYGCYNVSGIIEMINSLSLL